MRRPHRAHSDEPSRADPDLRGRERTFVTDSDPYFTTLDLSKPLPPKWEFARTQERAPVAAAGFAIALLLGLQLSRTLVGQSRRGEAQQWLEVTREALGSLPRALAFPAGVVAIAATVIVFLLPLLRSAVGQVGPGRSCSCSAWAS